MSRLLSSSSPHVLPPPAGKHVGSVIFLHGMHRGERGEGRGERGEGRGERGEGRVSEGECLGDGRGQMRECRGEGREERRSILSIKVC